MNKEEKSSNKCPICERPTHKESKYCIFHTSVEEKTKDDFKKALMEYAKKIIEKEGDYNFEKFIFIGDIDFKKDLNVTVFKNAIFSDATFKGDAVFSDATFKGGSSAVFSDATFKGDAIFDGVTFEGRSSALFWHATFKKNAYFTGATFEGGAVFSGATFKENAYFQHTTFERGALFDEKRFKLTFKGNAFLQHTTFERGALFDEKRSKPTFKGNAFFSGAYFMTDAAFLDITFKKDADFTGATFKEGAIFKGVTFDGVAVSLEAALKKGGFSYMNAASGGIADFTGATFKGEAEFQEVTFKKDAVFTGATFEDDADFKLKYFNEILNFSRIKVSSGKKLFIRLNNEGGKISFERAYLENAYLEIGLVKGTLIDFTGAILRNTKIEKDQIENYILQEKKKEFSRAKKVYLLLKNNYHSIGQYREESWAFTKERDMEKMSKSFCSLLDKYKKYSIFKKILKKSNLLKRVIVKTKIFRKWLFSKKAIEWFNLSVSDFIYQYGENPWRVIRFALIIIFLFAIILNFSGIVISDRTNLIIEFIKESQGDEYTLKYLGPILGGFLNCLYFSVVTFTTLGYGDFQPAEGASRFFVSLESIIGAITMALFVYTFARRTGGR